MKPSTRRLASYVVAVAVGAILAGLATTDTFAKKPQETGPKALRIEVTLLSTAYGAWGDAFTAKGAVKDSGDVLGGDYCDWILVGEQGALYVEFWQESFEIVDGSGPYADFVGATGEVNREYVEDDPFDLDGDGVFGAWYVSFKAFPPN
jgi:hypothetical protein